MKALKAELEQAKGREGEAHSKWAVLRAEFARQGRVSSFKEVVGTHMANVRTQLEEVSKIPHVLLIYVYAYLSI